MDYFKVVNNASINKEMLFVNTDIFLILEKKILLFK